MQRMVAAILVVAGVAVLAGPGWALLAAGGALWFRDDRAAAWLTARRQQLTGWWGQAVAAVRAAPRRVVAGSAMGAGVATVSLGAGLAFGLGLGLVAAGGLLVGMSVLTGWGA